MCDVFIRRIRYMSGSVYPFIQRGVAYLQKQKAIVNLKSIEYKMFAFIKNETAIFNAMLSIRKNDFSKKERISTHKSATHMPYVVPEELYNFDVSVSRRGTSINRHFILCLPLNTFNHLN